METFNWQRDYRGNLDWLKDRTILLVKHGSHAYGLNTPESDLDIKGVAIPPAEYFHGFLKRFEQAESKSPDMVIYGILKFFQLAVDCNPNIIEVLWVADEDVIQENWIGAALRHWKHDFLSKKARYTFSGYAHAQLKRIKTHKKWLLNPPDHKPTRLEFGLPETSLLSKDILGAVEAVIKDSNGREISEAEFQLGVERFGANVMTVYQKERGYHNAMVMFAQYENWKATRNPDRAALEARYGYDCYDDETTEFLTDNGWMNFDGVLQGESHLATIPVAGGSVEWQSPVRSICYDYTGIMYELEPYSSRAIVTPNHYMLVSQIHRQKSNGFTTAYEAKTAAWQLIPMTELISGTKAFFHTRRAPDARFSEYPIDDDYLRLAGLFISEGSIEFRGETVKAVRFSQKFPNDFFNAADALMGVYPLHRFSYDKETVWAASGSTAKLIYEDFGHAKEKHLPPWCLQLSARQSGILWDHLMMGDGHSAPHRDVYYTSLERLADDIQAMLIASGIPATKYGPYSSVTNYGPNTMYHVVRSKKTGSFNALDFHQVLQPGQETSGKNGHPIRAVEVKNKRVVCFEVSNSTLITRNNGKVAIHGNCKHAMHLVRLMKMCAEILTKGKVIVKRLDRDELLAIRNGDMEYDALIEWAEKQDAEMAVLAEASTLRDSPDRVHLDGLCQCWVTEYLNGRR